MVVDPDDRLVAYTRVSWEDVAEGYRAYRVVFDAVDDIVGVADRILAWGVARAMEVAGAHRCGEQRIVMIDGHTFDVPPADHMLMVTNDDRPGVIGTVGVLLGDAGVNIADMDVGRAEVAGTAVMLIAPTTEVEAPVLDALRRAPGIINVASLRG